MERIKVRLGEADREALDVPAEMSIDPSRLRVSENRQLRASGWATPQAWLDALLAEDLEAVFFLVWLACRRHGYKGTFADLDFEITDLDLDVPTPPQAGDGVGEAPAPPAGDSTTS